MMVQMLGVFAEFERATIVDRVIAGMERKAARGEWNGGPQPFGYTSDATAGRLVPKEGEASLLPVIFELYAKQRLGARRLAAWPNERGHRTRLGRLWSTQAVLTVLRNHVYLGEVHSRGAQHPGRHAALVERDLFDAAQGVLTERGADYSVRRSNPCRGRRAW
jgi:site-specific DNA recombinase